jgi:protein required for attachment to host cells
MKPTWIAVCDRINARVFTKRPFHIHYQLANEVGRERNRALGTDKPGVSRAKFGRPSSLHSLTGEKNPHDDLARAFSKRIGLYLKRQYDLGNFGDLILVAEPKMMGFLRRNLPAAVRKNTAWITKDLGKIKNQHIAKALAPVLAPPPALTSPRTV